MYGESYIETEKDGESWSKRIMELAISSLTLK